MVRNRVVQLATALLAVIALFGAIAQCSPVRQARVTPTPTKTMRPTFTPTAEASPTPVPSPTPFPTLTFTPLPPTEPPAVATATVTAAATPTLPPTVTPTPRPPAATPTRRPAATRTKTPTPKPTNTLPPPFKGSFVHGWARCDMAAVTGFVYHANKSPYPGVAVGVWSNLWDGVVNTTKEDGKFDALLTGMPAGTYYVAVVEPGTCQSGARGCQLRSNVLNAAVTENCSGSGANQVSEVRFDGP